MDYYTSLSSLDQNTQEVLISALGTFGIIIFVLVSIGLIIFITSLWRIFVKAGRPGWFALIPLFNMYAMLEVVKKPGWWIILFFIPLIQYIVQAILGIEIGKAFGKSNTFSAIFLLLFPIGYLIIAFDKSKYIYSTTTPSPTIPQVQVTEEPVASQPVTPQQPAV